MKNKIDFLTVMKEGFEFGMKNIPSLLGSLVLWILTIWIPYVNVGTTIAIATIPLQLSKGTIFSPLSIFDQKYYRYMGEYFLTSGLIFIGCFSAALLMFIPAIAVYLSWSLAILLVLDKGVNAAESIRLSNKLTYGNKWTIFFVFFVSIVVFWFVNFIISMLFLGIGVGLASVSPLSSIVVLTFLNILISMALYIVLFAYLLGCQASIYKTLSANIEETH